jgi:hypothetical protein
MAAPGLVLARFWATTASEEVAAFRQGFEAAAENSDTIFLLVVIDADSGTPSKDIRDALGRLLGTYSDRIAAWGGCVCGKGLAATSKRTMMRVILSLGRMRSPWTVENRPENAANWLAEQVESQLNDTADAESWIRAVARLRSVGPSAESA